MILQRTTSITLLLTLWLAGCGGGGGGGTPPPTPTALAFGMSPSSEELQSEVFGAITVRILDNLGNLVTGDNATLITLTLNTGTGTLSGTQSRIVAGGVSVFDDLRYDATETITIQASASTLTPVTSGPIVVRAATASGLAIARVSVNSSGVQGNGSSGDRTTDGRGGPPSVSADGRYVAFQSLSDNLVAGDMNAVRDVFVRDRVAGTTSRISVSSAGVEGNLDSIYASISANGRYVAFESTASNLVPNDTNGLPGNDIFVHDRETGETKRVSIASDGSQADSGGRLPSISATGRYITFVSGASNLVPGDTNAQTDVFVHDQTTGRTTRISVATDGTEANASSFFSDRDVAPITPDGRFVAFISLASNLVPGDTNGFADVFVRDRDTDANGVFDEVGGVSTTRASVATGGAQANQRSGFPSISADGRHVAFESQATTFDAAGGGFGAFVHDRQTLTTVRVSVASGGTPAGTQSFYSSLSADGRFVTFVSRDTNLVTGDLNGVDDIFVHDRDSDGNSVYDEPAGTATVRISVDSGGLEADAIGGHNHGPRISANGRYVGFVSEATNLVAGDSNALIDAFIAPNPLAP